MKQLNLSRSSPDRRLSRQHTSYTGLKKYYPEHTLIRLDRVSFARKTTGATHHQENHLSIFLAEELTSLANALDQLVVETQSKTGISDVNHPRYPSLAKEALRRRNNLLATVSFLQAQSDSAV